MLWLDEALSMMNRHYIDFPCCNILISLSKFVMVGFCIMQEVLFF